MGLTDSFARGQVESVAPNVVCLLPAGTSAGPFIGPHQGSSLRSPSKALGFLPIRFGRCQAEQERVSLREARSKGSFGRGVF